MKKNMLLLGLSFVFPLLAHAEISSSPDSRAIGNSITQSNLSVLTDALVKSGVYDVSGTDVDFPAKSFSGRPVSSSLTFDPSTQTINMRLNLRVAVQFHIGSNTDTYAFDVRWTPVVIEGPEKKYKMRPELLTTSDEMIKRRVASRLRGIFADPSSWADLSFFGTSYPDIPAELIAEPVNFHITADRLYFGNIIRTVSLLNKAATTDYDGDGRSDLSVKVDAGYGRFEVDYSMNGFSGKDDEIETGYIGGDPGDVAVPADYNGDGYADLGVKRQNGVWAIKPSANGLTAMGPWSEFLRFGDDGWGGTECAPVPADYDGDGIADLSVMCTEQYDGVWYIDYSADGFGNAIGIRGPYAIENRPVPGDYDGDGRADLGVKNPQGWWAVDYASNGYGSWDWATNGWGGEEYLPAQADYDGDGKTDIALVLNSGYTTWYIDYAADGFGPGYEQANENYSSFSTWPIDPAPSDYDGDGKADLAGKDLWGYGYWLIDYSADGFGYANEWIGGWGDPSAHPLHKSAAIEDSKINNVRGEITFGFSLPHAATVRIVAVDLHGKTVAKLFDGNGSEGVNTVSWNKKDLSAKGLKKGMYILHLQAGTFKTSKRLMLTE